MSNNFNYLEYANVVENTGVNRGRVNNRGNNRKSESLRNIEKDAVSKKELQHFRNVFMDLLVRDYEKPFSFELEMIRSRRGEEEYRQDVRRIYERLGKMRESAEETLLGVKRYLDYVEVKEDKGNARLYLPGLEDKTKLGEIKLPDLLGFTQTDAKKEQYGMFILGMVRTFLGFEGQSLWEAMEYLNRYVDSLADYSGMNIELCNMFVSEPKLMPLYRINAYYDLLKMMENGRFDINKFLKRKTDKSDRDKNRDKDRDRDKGKKKRRGLYSGGGEKKDKKGNGRHKEKRKKGGLKGEIKLVEDRGDGVDKKIEYILKLERDMEKLGKDKGGVNELMERVRTGLRKTGVIIFCNITKMSLRDFGNIYEYNKLDELSKITEEEIDGLKSAHDSKLYNMGNDSLKTNEIEIVDFYTDKKRYLKKGERLKGRGYGNDFDFNKDREENNRDKNNKGENNQTGGVNKDDQKVVYILVRSYGELYKTYGFNNLPMSNDSPLQSLRNAILILNGLVIYLNVLREMIILLERKLMDDMGVRNIEEERKRESEKGERMDEELKRGRSRYLEYREILRELNRQIMAERNKNKLNRLMRLKDEVLKKSGLQN